MVLAPCMEEAGVPTTATAEQGCCFGLDRMPGGRCHLVHGLHPRDGEGQAVVGAAAVHAGSNRAVCRLVSLGGAETRGGPGRPSCVQYARSRAILRRCSLHLPSSPANSRDGKPSGKETPSPGNSMVPKGETR